MTKENKFIPYKIANFSSEELIEKSKKYFQEINKRRSVRDFLGKDVPKEVIKNIIKTAGSAPSGAHKQPWTFCVISDKKLKSEIRKLAEKEEFEKVLTNLELSGKRFSEAVGKVKDDVAKTGYDRHSRFFRKINRFSLMLL